LKYEHDFYVSARKRFPKEGKALRTGRGAERVMAVDIFRERVFLRSDEQGPRIIALIDLREELERLGEPPPEARGQRPEIAAGAARPRDDSSTPRPREDRATVSRPRDDAQAARPRDDAPAAPPQGD